MKALLSVHPKLSLKGAPTGWQWHLNLGFARMVSTRPELGYRTQGIARAHALRRAKQFGLEIEEPFRWWSTEAAGEGR